MFPEITMLEVQRTVLAGQRSQRPSANVNYGALLRALVVKQMRPFSTHESGRVGLQHGVMAMRQWGSSEMPTRSPDLLFSFRFVQAL